MIGLRRSLLLALGLGLAACGGSGSGNHASPRAASPKNRDISSESEASARIGPASARASVVQTSMLPDSMAGKYNIDRSPGTVLLLVTVRSGDGADAKSVAAKVRANATGLHDGIREIAIREIRTPDPGSDATLVDYVGSVTTSLPNTLRFDISISTAQGTATLQLSRDFYPQ